MKDLIDELHKLDNEEYKVSADFSKKVMRQIKKENRFKMIKYVASLASVACVVGLSFMLIKNNGLADRILKAGQSEDAMQASTYNSNLNSSDINKKENDTSFEYLEENKVRMPNDSESEKVSSDANYELSTPATSIQGLNDSSNSAVETIEISVDELLEDSNVNNANNIIGYKDDTKKAEENRTVRTYSKQLSREEYLNEIIEILKKNNYDFTNNETFIQINNAEFNTIYNLIEEYIDVEISISGDDLILKLKE